MVLCIYVKFMTCTKKVTIAKNLEDIIAFFFQLQLYSLLPIDIFPSINSFLWHLHFDKLCIKESAAEDSSKVGHVCS